MKISAVLILANLLSCERQDLVNIIESFGIYVSERVSEFHLLEQVSLQCQVCQ
jgi:hypothetical protein